MTESRVPSAQKMDWEALAGSIADGEAILVLGPNAIPFYAAVEREKNSDESFNSLSNRCIIEQLGSRISHYYERDNLFLFQDAAAKRDAMKIVRTVSRDERWLPDIELVRQIVGIPFSVVLNINPDKVIYDAFVRLYREPQFDYFTAKDKPTPPRLDYPDGYNKPLVYNLCGSVQDKLDSIILDYHDLFELVKNMLADNGVSEHLTRKLQEADRFIILGLELELWYFQLFIHYLNKIDNNPFNNPKENYPIFSRVSDVSRVFIMKQFKIQHIAPTRHEFELLYRACEQKGILRKLHQPGSPLEEQSRILTVQGRYEEAFALLEGNLNDIERKTALPHLRSRYNAWLQAQKDGRSDPRDLDIEINRIRYVLLTLANQLNAP